MEMDIRILLSICVIYVHCVTAASIQEFDQQTKDVSDPDRSEPVTCFVGVRCTVYCLLHLSTPVCPATDQLSEPEPGCLCHNAKYLTKPAETEQQSKILPDSVMHFFAKIYPFSETDDTAKKEGYIVETVNVHEGRLFYSFAFILIGLFITIIALIAYELFMCRYQSDSPNDQVVLEKPNPYNFQRLK